jgi:hypothetical protein
MTDYKYDKYLRKSSSEEFDKLWKPGNSCPIPESIVAKAAEKRPLATLAIPYRHRIIISMTRPRGALNGE